jgi:hypothetical protein
MHYDVLTLDQALEAISKARDIETLHRAHCSSAAALARGRVRQAIAHSIFEGNPPLETKDRAATVLKGAIDDLAKAMIPVSDKNFRKRCLASAFHAAELEIGRLSLCVQDRGQA